MDADTYQYEKLPKDKTIRYLILNLATVEDDLSGSLVITSIEEAEFDAISYVWGSLEKVS